MDLTRSAANVFSLSGEEGIIAEFLRRLGLDALETEHWSDEIGASDRVYLSNTLNPVPNTGWNAIYVKPDEETFTDLLRLAARYPDITPIRAMVSANPESPFSLDALLGTHLLPRDFTLLSIDIDGDDLEVWESIAAYHPIIVFVKVDSSPGSEIDSLLTTTGGTSGFDAALKVGPAMGYTTVCHPGNVIFVRSDLASRALGKDSGLHSVHFDSRWMQSPSFRRKVRSLFRYGFYLTKKRICWNP